MRLSAIPALAASAALSLAAFAATDAVAGGAKTEGVLKSELHGAALDEANIVRFEVEPGWASERHIHPGHVFVYVTEGTLEIDVEGEPQRTVSAGEAFHELPDKPMIARAATATEGAKFVVFQVGPAGEPIMVPHPE